MTNDEMREAYKRTLEQIEAEDQELARVVIKQIARVYIDSMTGRAAVCDHTGAALRQGFARNAFRRIARAIPREVCDRIVLVIESPHDQFYAYDSGWYLYFVEPGKAAPEVVGEVFRATLRFETSIY